MLTTNGRKIRHISRLTQNGTENGAAEKTCVVEPSDSSQLTRKAQVVVVVTGFGRSSRNILGLDSSGEDDSEDWPTLGDGGQGLF